MNNTFLQNRDRRFRINVLTPSFLFYLLLGVFFLFKLSHILIPYHWDELGVYSKAALYMFDNQIALWPGVIPPDLSRGHPLLCAAVFAASYKLFGPFVWVGHLTALLISCVLLVITYQFGKKIFGSANAALASVLLMVQPVFIAQSAMVLPEIMLSCLFTAAVFSYVSNRYIMLALTSMLAIMVKETAVALPAAIFAIEFFAVLFKKRIDKSSINAISAAAMPLVLWGLFLMYQKYTEGWFFFPLHTDYISFSIKQIVSRISYYLSFLFKGQGRYIWFISLSFSIILFCYNRRFHLLAVAVKEIQDAAKEKHPYFCLPVFIGFGLLVSMLNFHLARYMLFILPLVAILTASSIVHIARASGKTIVFYVLVAPFCVVPFFYYKADTFSFDADMGYLRVVKVQQQISDYLNNNYPEDTRILSNFPINTGLMEPRAGYTDQPYTNLTASCKSPEHSGALLYVYTQPGNLDYCTPNKDNLVLLKEFKSSYAKGFIYQKSDS